MVCKDCAEAIVRADNIIKKCQESQRILQDHRRELLKAQEQQRLYLQQLHTTKTEVFEEECLPPQDPILIHTPPPCKQEQEDSITGSQEELAPSNCFTHNYAIEPELLVESVLENTIEDNLHDMNLDNAILAHKEKKTRKPRTRKKPKTTAEDNTLSVSEENPAALIYQSHFKTSKPKKTFIRSREQYLKRKIRNYPVLEPLTLIGGAGVTRKRKPKSYHRAIPNFYFRCELCHEFETNVATFAVTHLTQTHGIQRPAIFRCSLCNAKPFIKNQSLQEHIATIHEQQPKKRDFVCQECGKTFIKNCHLQKHLLSVHKLGQMPYRCNIPECGKGYVDAYAMRMHLKQAHQMENEEEIHMQTKQYVEKQLLRNQSDDDYNCLQCGYSFRQKSRYEAHVRRAKCKPPCFVCRYCEMSFVKLVALEEHQREMH